MRGTTCTAILVFATMVSLGRADVLLDYDPVLLDVGGGGEIEITLSLTGNDGFEGLTSAIILDYSPVELEALGVRDFAWDGQPDFENPNSWFVDATLPAPSAVSFGATLPIVAGELTPIATFTVDPESGDQWTLDANATIGDENAAPLEVKSGPQTFFIPEPASLGLLAMGALAAIRRRR